MIRQWYYDGVAVPGATGKTVTVGAGQLDRTLWECRTQVDYGSDSVAGLIGFIPVDWADNGDWASNGDWAGL